MGGGEKAQFNVATRPCGKRQGKTNGMILIASDTLGISARDVTWIKSGQDFPENLSHNTPTTSSLGHDKAGYEVIQKARTGNELKTAIGGSHT